MAWGENRRVFCYRSPVLASIASIAHNKWNSSAKHITSTSWTAAGSPSDCMLTHSTTPRDPVHDPVLPSCTLVPFFPISRPAKSPGTTTCKELLPGDRRPFAGTRWTAARARTTQRRPRVEKTCLCWLLLWMRQFSHVWLAWRVLGMPLLMGTTTAEGAPYNIQYKVLERCGDLHKVVYAMCHCFAHG